MPDVRHMARMERVLEARVKQQRKARRPLAGQVYSLVAALLAAAICFFLLKGIMLAQLGAERFDAIAAPMAQGDRMAVLRFWIAGPDPVSTFLAQAIAPPPASAVGAQGN